MPVADGCVSPVCFGREELDLSTNERLYTGLAHGLGLRKRAWIGSDGPF